MFKIPYNKVVDYSSAHYWGGMRKSARERALDVTANKVKERMERARLTHTNHMMDQIEETQEHISNLEINKPGEDDKSKVSLGTKLALVEQHDRIARKTLKLDDETTGDPVRDGFNFLIGMAKAHRTLVNENGESTEPEGEGQSEAQNITDVDAEIVTQTPQSEAENTSSATIPLPVDSNAFAGILSPFNGHINGLSNTQNEPISGNNGESGDKTLKKLPRKIITSSR